MSFTNTIGATAPKLAQPALRAVSLAGILQGIGLALAAGLLAAVYQVAHDEMRNILTSLRHRGRFRQARHEAILLTLLGSELDLELQGFLLRSRDAFSAALDLLRNPDLSHEDRLLVRSALYRANINVPGTGK